MNAINLKTLTLYPTLLNILSLNKIPSVKACVMKTKIHGMMNGIGRKKNRFISLSK
jgi:hypothetical protein